YATLRYCWGKGVALRTTTENAARHRAGIPLSTSPLTIRESVTLASRLEVRYLWIDALCIMHDDQDDWNDQAAKMSIYRGCSLHIA
ncbi:heterokaryon incompatibility, partial [Parathielavia hyrcaniae]